MKIIYNILAILSMLLVSCSEDRILPDTNYQDGGTIRVYLKTGSESTTRTNLISSDNRQHAKYVHLYVFDNAGNCVQSTNINWAQPIGTTAEQSYSLKGLVKGQKYTLLAVGIDENPTDGKTTYNLPDAIQKNVTTLTGLMATLADGKTKEDIARSELFSGWIEVTAGTTASATISLYRRVAGVLAYIKDIPTEVAIIQIKIYKNQYKNVPLQKVDRSNQYDTSDHGNTVLANSQVLMSIPVNTTELNKTKLGDGHGFTVTKQTGTVLQGAYVLPIEASESPDQYTMTLETYSMNSTTVPLKTYNIKMLTTTEHGSGTQETVLANYPLYANQFYSIGKKDIANGTDEPVSLGEDLVITVNPDWEGGEIFPLE